MQDNPFDKACRYLAKLEPAALLAWLLGLNKDEIDFVRWLDTRRLSFPGQPDRTCDTVAHLENIAANRLPWAVILEFMIEPDPLMFGRLLGYLGLVWMEEKPANERGDRFEMGAVLVNLRGKGQVSRRQIWARAGLETTLQVREINFSIFSAADALDHISRGLWPSVILPWIPLMQGGDESSNIEKWKVIASSEPNSQRRSDFGGLALVFAEAVDCWDVWKVALKEWNVIESKQVKEWQEQARKEGLQEGEHKGCIRMLLQYLQDKFGNLPPDLQTDLRAIKDAGQFTKLLHEATQASSFEEFSRLLPNGAKN